VDVNDYEVVASFRARVSVYERTEWKCRVRACNRDHALLLAGMRLVAEHPGIVAASLRTTVTRQRAA
jgi:hypothetical protein